MPARLKNLNVVVDPEVTSVPENIQYPEFSYSHLSNNRGGGAKVAKSINVEVGIKLEGGIFFRKN